MSRLRRLRRWWPILAGAFVALLIYAAWPGRSTFTVSPETTYIVEPLDSHGQPDYQSALNERLQKGVSPETNANVLIWLALGPHPEGGTMPPEYFRWLGVESPAEDGEYLLASDKYFQEHLKDRPVKEPEGPEGIDLPPDPQQEWRDELDRTRRWPWKGNEHPDVADWLKRNEKPLAVAIEASKRPQYFNPLSSKVTDPGEPRILSSLIPNVQRCREIANALAIRAMRRVADGDSDGAWRDLMAVQRLGRLVGRGATLIDSLVGYALIAIATDGQLTVLSHGPHPPNRLLAWSEEVRQLPPLPAFADKLDLGERFMTLDSLRSLAVHGAQSPGQLGGPSGGQPPANRFADRLFTHNIDWDPAFRNANRTFDRAAAAARLPDRAARKQAFAQISNEVEQANAAVRQIGVLGRAALGKGERGNHIGNILIGLMLPAMEKIQNATDRTEQILRNLQVALALAAYRADHDRYPARLDELAPKYLPSVPGDLFSGVPLVYRPEKDGYVLYSVGVNERDEDGRWTDNDPPGDDPRVRMPVPEPKPKSKPKPEPARRFEID